MTKTLGATKIRPARTRGFTLIELLIVLTVIGILTAVAYPSYTESVRRSRHSDATTDLMEAAQTLERCYTQLGNVYDDPSCPIQSAVEITSSEGFYQVTPTVTATTYSLGRGRSPSRGYRMYLFHPDQYGGEDCRRKPRG